MATQKKRQVTKAKKQQRVCHACGEPLTETTTDFPVVKKSAVYVVENVPALECQNCGAVVFTDAVVAKLEKLSSGHVIQTAMKRRSAYLYDFSKPFVDLSDKSDQRNMPVPDTTPVPKRRRQSDGSKDTNLVLSESHL